MRDRGVFRELTFFTFLEVSRWSRGPSDNLHSPIVSIVDHGFITLRFVVI